MNKINLYEKAIREYGSISQIDICVEEMSELTKALLKHRRAKGDVVKEKKAEGNIKEEMADVSIMLEQMELLFGDYSKEKEKKLARLDKRLAEKGEKKERS